MLEILKLKASRENKEILRGVSLKIRKNETHAIMGPNGSGKSTLASVLMGNPDINVLSGSIIINGENLLEMPVDQRAKKGLFLAFQYPVEVPGVPLLNFLRLAYQSRFGEKITPGKLLMLVNAEAEKLKIKKDLVNRYLNEGFSGGEKKKVEILQMSLLKPEYAVLDETDSGLDISSLRTVAKAVSEIKKKTGMGVLIITHYSRILTYLEPDFVHILNEGKIVKSGGMEVAEKLEEKGYEDLENF